MLSKKPLIIKTFMKKNKTLLFNKKDTQYKNLYKKIKHNDKNIEEKRCLIKKCLFIIKLRLMEINNNGKKC